MHGNMGWPAPEPSIYLSLLELFSLPSNTPTHQNLPLQSQLTRLSLSRRASESSLSSESSESSDAGESQCPWGEPPMGWVTWGDHLALQTSLPIRSIFFPHSSGHRGPRFLRISGRKTASYHALHTPPRLLSPEGGARVQKDLTY